MNESVVLFAPVRPRPEGALLIGANCVDLLDDAEAPYIVRPYAGHADVARAAKYCWAETLALTHGLQGRLNECFDLDRGPDYWESLLLPWLAAWTENLYDRYLRLAWVREHCPGATLQLPRGGLRTPLYRKSFDVWSQSHFHSTNLTLYKMLIAEMGLGGRVRHSDREAAEDQEAPSRRPRLARAAKRWLKRLVPGPRDDSFEYAKGVPLHVEMRDEGFAREPVDRHRLRVDRDGDEFARVAGRLLPSLIPVALVEEFRSRSAYASSFVERRRLRALHIANAFWNNDTLKYVMAEVRHRDGRLIGQQHGAGYGTFAVSMAEVVERHLSDVFLTWGWSDEVGGRTVAVPDPRLSRIAGTHRPESDRILYVGSHLPMYMIRYQSYWMPEFVHDRYCPMQARFLRQLQPSIQHRLVYRPYPQEYGWRERERVARTVTGVPFDLAPSSIESMRRAALVVIDNPATTMLESLVVNAPTVLYWDPTQGVMRPSAEPLFEELRRAGILYNSPDDAARHVNAIADQPAAWWRRPEVQRARETFCARFAWAAPDWKSRWRHLEDLAS